MCKLTMKKAFSFSLVVLLSIMVVGMFFSATVKAQTVYSSPPSLIDSDTQFYISNHWPSQDRNFLLNGYWYTFYHTSPVTVERYGYSIDGVNWQTLAVPGVVNINPANFGVAVSNGSFHISFGNTTGLYYGTLNSEVNGVLSASNISLIFNGGGRDYNIYPNFFSNVFIDNLGKPWITYCQITGTVGNYTESLYIDHSNATANNLWVSANGIFPYCLGITQDDYASQFDPLASMVSYSDNTVQWVYSLTYIDNITSLLFNSTTKITNFNSNSSLTGDVFTTHGYSAQYNLIKTSNDRVFWISPCIFSNGTSFQGLIEMNKTAIVKVTNAYQYWGAFQLAIFNNEIVIQGSTLNPTLPENITVKFYNLTSNILSSDYLVVPNVLKNTFDYGSEYNEGVQLSKTADSNGTYLLTFINYPDENLYSVLVNFNSDIQFPELLSTPTATLSRSDIATNNVFNNMYIALGLIGVSFIVLACIIIFMGANSDGDTNSLFVGLLLLIGSIVALVVGFMIIMGFQNSMVSLLLIGWK